MNRVSRMAGVTLLEIMLVLAIAAMVIVMSIRYYQSAVTSQQLNVTLQQLQGIMAAADSYAQTSGAYNNPAVSNSALQPMLPSNAFTLPWGGSMTIAPSGASAYTITFSPAPPAAVCSGLKTRFGQNRRVTIPTDCATFNYSAVAV